MEVGGEGRFVDTTDIGVKIMNTTGAGNVLHGAVCESWRQGQPRKGNKEQSTAMTGQDGHAERARAGSRESADETTFKERRVHVGVGGGGGRKQGAGQR